MDRKSFFKNIFGATAAVVIGKIVPLDKKKVEVAGEVGKIAYGGKYFNLNKSFLSAIDPILDTREFKSNLYDIYNEDALTEILNLADREQPHKQYFIAK